MWTYVKSNVLRIKQIIEKENFVKLKIQDYKLTWYVFVKDVFYTFW